MQGLYLRPSKTKTVAARVQKYEVGTVGDVEALTKYFGESYNPVDPGRVLRVVRDFMLLFDAAMLKIQVGHVPPPVTMPCPGLR